MIAFLRRRRLIAVILPAIASFGIVIVTQWLDRRNADGAVLAQIEKLNVTDPDWTFEKIDARRKKYEPEENGAVRTLEIAALMPKDWPVWANDRKRNFNPLQFDDDRELPDPIESVYRILRNVNTHDPREALDPRALALLENELQRAGPALIKAKELERCTGGRYALDYKLAWPLTLVADLQKARDVAGLLELQAVARSQRRDAEGACTAALRMGHVARGLGDEYTMISQLVRIAVMTTAVKAAERGLSVGDVQLATLRKLQALFEMEERECLELLLHAAHAERALTHRMLQALWEGQINFEQLGTLRWRPENDWQRVASFFGLAHIRWQHAAFLREVSEEIETWKMPWDPLEVKPPMAGELEAQPANGDRWYKNYVGGLSRIRHVVPRQHAILRCAIAALASEQFRLEHKRWPNSLDELTPRYLPAILRDPYERTDLKSVHAGGRLAIYSIGSDGIDNGGAIGPGRFHHVDSDLGFALWDRSERGIKFLP